MREQRYCRFDTDGEGAPAFDILFTGFALHMVGWGLDAQFLFEVEILKLGDC